MSGNIQIRTLRLTSLIGLFFQTTCVMSPPSNASSDGNMPHDRGEFAAEIVQKLNAAHPPHPISKSGPLTLTTQSADHGLVTMHLDRLYDACESAPDRCAEFVERTIVGENEFLKFHPTALKVETLRVAVRPQSTLRDNATVASSFTQVITADAPPGLIALIYSDQPLTMRAVTERELATLHLSNQAAYDVGLKNLKSDLPPIDHAGRALPPRRIAVLRRGPYESSRILMHNDWSALSALFGGHLLVAVPAADEIMFTDGNSEQDVNAIANAAYDDFRRAERGISPNVFLWRKTGWVAVTPDQTR